MNSTVAQSPASGGREYGRRKRSGCTLLRPVGTFSDAGCAISHVTCTR
ncbi:hypothetical protein [Brevibacillus thermoruber]|nr:hypothetical protein [Brevibacillus thermoruber]